ncbi:hypothetical protein KIPB_017313, partial [Kipferlia bialata]
YRNTPFWKQLRFVVIWVWLGILTLALGAAGWYLVRFVLTGVVYTLTSSVQTEGGGVVVTGNRLVVGGEASVGDTSTGKGVTEGGTTGIPAESESPVTGPYSLAENVSFGDETRLEGTSPSGYYPTHAISAANKYVSAADPVLSVLSVDAESVL